MKEVLDALKGHRTSNIVSSTFIVQYLPTYILCYSFSLHRKANHIFKTFICSRYVPIW